MKTFEKNIRRVEPYVPGEQPQTKVIKLNTNENPYPPSPRVGETLQKLDADRFRLYPDPSAKVLVDAIAKYHGLSPEQVFVGVGSDDVLAMCFLTFFNSDKPILFPDLSYSFYPVWADLYRIPFERPALDGDFHLVKEDYFRENGGIIFPNPNAPTAVYETQETVEAIVAANPDVIVIVDEAYVDFAPASAVPLIDKYENLLVVQTFSKSRSMAGMRIGYVLGNAQLIRYLNDVKYAFNSYTINQAALACGAASMEDQAYFTETCEKIIETREWAKDQFRELGFTFPDGQANFLFVTHPEVEAEVLFEALKTAGIYVRYLRGARSDCYLRITIGTRKEMETLFAFLRSYLQEERNS